MDILDNDRNDNKRISVSRNHPSAFVVGAGNFVASALIEKLLESKTQVLAFDRLNPDSRDNLAEAFKYKHFYFFGVDEGFSSESLQMIDGDLPSVGYAFFFVNEDTTTNDLKGFINLCVKFQNGQSSKDVRRIKCLFVSSIGLYKKDLSGGLRRYKALEVLFAKEVADNHLNGRVVRLAAVYGPKMSFDQEDPMAAMIAASLNGTLREGGVSDEFSTRAIYLDNAVDLLLKSMMYGSTAMKIYDGALVHPVKVTEVRHILVDPESAVGLSITKLSPWLSPNLEKTVRELNWSPESDLPKSFYKTLAYFRKNPERVSLKKAAVNEPIARVREERIENGKSKAKGFWEENEVVETKVAKRVTSDLPVESSKKSWGSKIGYLILILLVGYGLIYPMVVFSLGVARIGWNLNQATEKLTQGEFNQAIEKSNEAVVAVEGIKQGIGPLNLVSRIGIAKNEIETVSALVDSAVDGVVAIRDANVGFYSLSQVTGVISGENTADPAKIYSDANVALRSSRDSLTKVSIELKNIRYEGLLFLVRGQIESLRTMVLEYSIGVSKGELASTILPKLTGVDGTDKSYLVLLQNNKLLRPSGGAVEAVARIDFRNGKLENIETQTVDELDSLGTPLAAPADVREDLGGINWSLRDASFEPDFAGNSKVVQLLYQRDTGKKVDGVIGMTVSSFNEMIAALKGVNTSNGQIRIDGKILGKDFFEVVTDSKIYSELLSQTLNKMFFLEDVNWAELGMVIENGLSNKNIQMFVDDKASFAYITSQNWGGVMPRAGELVVGQENDFLSINDTVIATGSANIELTKNIDTQTIISEDLGVSHKVGVSYLARNIDGSVSSVKSRVKIYVPGGNKLERVSMAGVDVTKDFKTNSDYGRVVFSGLIAIPIDQNIKLEVQYSAGVVKLDNGKLDYRMDIVKQAGSGSSDVVWKLTFPDGWKVTALPSRAISSRTEVSMSDILNADLTITTSLLKP